MKAESVYLWHWSTVRGFSGRQMKRRLTLGVDNNEKRVLSASADRVDLACWGYATGCIGRPGSGTITSGCGRIGKYVVARFCGTAPVSSSYKQRWAISFRLHVPHTGWALSHLDFRFRHIRHDAGVLCRFLYEASITWENAGSQLRSGREGFFSGSVSNKKKLKVCIWLVLPTGGTFICVLFCGVKSW